MHAESSKGFHLSVMVRLSGLLLIILTLFFLELFNLNSPSSYSKILNSSPRYEEGVSEIRLDFNPLENPISVSLAIIGDGSARIVSYSRYLLVVNTIQQGKLPEADLKRIINKASSNAIKDALRRKDRSAKVLPEGDQFYLYIKLDSVIGEGAGFVDEMPAAVKDLIKDLLYLKKRLPSVPLAEAYLRSRPIESARLEMIRKGGMLHLIALKEYPADLQQLLIEAVENPGDFHALSRSQYDRLLEFTSHGNEFFVLDQEKGHQMTLFRAQ